MPYKWKTSIDILLKAYLIMGFVFMFYPQMYGQNQMLADSLESVYLQKEFKEENHLPLLLSLSQSQTIIDKRLKYIEELMSLSQELDSTFYLHKAYLEKGNALTKKGDLNEALENYLRAAEISLELDDENILGGIYVSIAGVYHNMQHHENTVLYYKKAIDLFESNKKVDSTYLGIANLNLGMEYLRVKQADSALIYLKESEPIFKHLNYEKGIAYAKGNIGMAFFLKNKRKQAEIHLDQAIEMLEPLEDYYSISEYLLVKSDISLVQKAYENALNYAFQSLNYANKLGLKKQISAANLKLSEIYEYTDNHEESLKHFKNHIADRDRIQNLSTVQEIADLRTEFEVSQKQVEVDILHQQKTNQKVLIFTMISLLGMTGLYYWKISKEKKRSDRLLLNILPTKTAEELKDSGKVKAKKFNSVSVMFTDFQAFTKYSQKLSPEKLVKSVDFYFSKFDKIIDRYELEKIKTIGDAYMCAGGLTGNTKEHNLRIIKAAWEIKNFVAESKDQPNDEIAHFDIRIGINTGPVVAGVVGKKKFAYDIWGDTVNVASRMESNSRAGMINISENTYRKVKKYFDCQYRGEIDVKNKGMMKMYFVLERKNMTI